MTATVAHIRKQIDNLAPDEARELLLDLQRSFSVPLMAAEDKEVEAAWEAEMDTRLQDVEQGRVRLVNAEEADQRTEKLFARLGLERPVSRP